MIIVDPAKGTVKFTTGDSCTVQLDPSAHHGDAQDMRAAAVETMRQHVARSDAAKAKRATEGT